MASHLVLFRPEPLRFPPPPSSSRVTVLSPAAAAAIGAGIQLQSISNETGDFRLVDSATETTASETNPITAAMSNKLVVRQTLGRNPNVRNCLTYVTDHHLAYVCGFQVVVINTETKEQNFISGTSTYQHQSLAITALASNISKRVIAVAEKVEPSGIVTFYDAVTLRRKKMLTHSELGSTEIRAMAFSEDGRFLVTQSAGPEWNLTLWNVEKGAKYLCATKI
eukprot:gene8805-11294_t